MTGDQLLTLFKERAVELSRVASCRVFDHGIVKRGGSRKLLILAGTHGNEVGGIGVQLEFMLKMIETPDTYADHEITLVIANPEAVRQNKRFIERDLNRCFGDAKTDSLEARRARELEPLLAEAGEIIDLHQTVQPSTTAFMLSPFHRPTFEMISRVRAQLPIVTYQGEFSGDGLTAGVFAQRHGQSSLTIETGSLGLHADQVAATLPMIEDILANLTLHTEVATSRLYTWDQTILRDGMTVIEPGLINFSLVEAGQILATRAGKKILADRDGFALFPKYDELAKTSHELLRTARQITNEELAEWKRKQEL